MYKFNKKRRFIMDKVSHFEIPADNVDRAKKFYEEVFGWRISSYPEMDYNFVYTVDVDENQMPKESGAINGGLYKRSDAGEPASIVITVSSIDESIKKVESAGGQVLVPKQDVGDMGVYARVKDSEGNVVGLWESKNM
jgi:hypothetical protein